MKRLLSFIILSMCLVHSSIGQIDITDLVSHNKLEKTSQQGEIQKQFDNLNYNQTYEIGNRIRTAGFATLGIGIAGLLGGAVCTTVVHVSKNPVEGYTTDWKTAQTTELKYLTEQEYTKKLGDWPEKMARVETASYFLYACGSTVVVVSIPIIIAGNKIMDLGLGYSSEGVGITANF